MRIILGILFLVSVSFAQQNIDWQLREITTKVETCQRQLTELNQERLNRESKVRQQELSQSIQNYGNAIANVMYQVHSSADFVGLCDGVPVKTRITGIALFSTILPIMLAIVIASIASHH